MNDFILIDFDTVICEGARREGPRLEGQPNPGALDALQELCVDRSYPIGILSRFTPTNLGPLLIREWFRRYGMDPAAIDWMHFPVTIPPFALLISGKCWNPAIAARARPGSPMLPGPALLAEYVREAALPVYLASDTGDSTLPTTDTFGPTG